MSRTIKLCSYNYFKNAVLHSSDTDKQCVKNVYLEVITEPYSTGNGDETAVRLSDELGLFTRYYSGLINSDTMADFVRSLKENQISMPPSMYGEAYQYCRSRYIQSPTELANYCKMLASSRDKMVADARLARARSASVKQDDMNDDGNKKDD